MWKKTKTNTLRQKIKDPIENWCFVSLIALRTSTVCRHIPKILYNSLFTDKWKLLAIKVRAFKYVLPASARKGSFYLILSFILSKKSFYGLLPFYGVFNCPDGFNVHIGAYSLQIIMSKAKKKSTFKLYPWNNSTCTVHCLYIKICH